jgi:hypothetical protein
MTKPNKVFNIELCPEDAQRILNGLKLLEDQLHRQIDECNTDEQKDVAWLEWTYASELLFMMDDIFDIEMW